MSDRGASQWWQKQGVMSLLVFWGILVFLSLFILLSPERPQEVLQSKTPTGYNFTFEEMDLRDQAEDGDVITRVHAKQAEYDSKGAQVFMVAPAIIVENTAGEELWRATAQSGRADVPNVSELFPSQLGDIRLATDVWITDRATGHVLSTSGVVSYLTEHKVLVSVDKTLVRMGRGTATFPYGFLMETLKGRRITQGRPDVDLVEEFLASKESGSDK
ncbi:MAG: LPS export ABC transporter periplasmic protein LptC [bacterium]